MFLLWMNQVIDFYQQNVTLPQVFFKHFASKNQLPGFYISGTLVKKGLIKKKLSSYFHVKFVFFLEGRLLFNVFYCFYVFVNKHFANFTSK